MKLKNFLRGGAGKSAVAAVTAVGLILIFALNLLLTYFGVEKLLYIDMTPEGLYTLSDEMVEYTSFIDELENDDRRITITFCADPDTLIGSQTLRLPYFMALGLEKLYDRVDVETVNVTYNPTAVSKYKATSLTTISPTDIIISYGDRYRIIGAKAMWVNDTDDKLYSFNGEYKMASILMSVTAKNRPAAYFVTNHGETYYDAENPSRVENAEAQAIYDLLSDRGLEVKTVDLSAVDDVPSDCVLLVINNPTSDFAVDGSQLGSFEYISETEKLDRYLVAEQGAIMVAADPVKLKNMPAFDGFLYEWGFDVSDGIVVDHDYYMAADDGSHTKIYGAYDTDEASYGMAIYESLASLPSAPMMAFSSTGYITCTLGPDKVTNESGTVSIDRNYAPFFYSSDGAKAYKVTESGEISSTVEYDAGRKGRMDLSAVTTRMEINQETAEYTYSYVFCTPSADAFSNEILGDASFANFDVMSALVENISRIDEHASLELGGVSLNSPKLGGKPLLDVTIYKTNTTEYSEETREEEIILRGLNPSSRTALVIIIMLVPAAVLSAGIYVRTRRKYK